MLLDEIISRAKLNPNNLIAVYAYGSRVYQTNHALSDYDFVVIVNDKDNEQFSDNLININFFTTFEHQTRLNDHEISALECHFLDKQYVLLEKKKFNFKLNLVKLRHALAAKSSHSWVMCKKKLTVPESYNLNVGRKSMFHAFRIIDFGIQIATHGRIINYSNSNKIYQEIFECYDWQTLFEKFKPRYNKISSQFRALVPKS